MHRGRCPRHCSHVRPGIVRDRHGAAIDTSSAGVYGVACPETHAMHGGRHRWRRGHLRPHFARHPKPGVGRSRPLAVRAGLSGGDPVHGRGRPRERGDVQPTIAGRSGARRRSTAAWAFRRSRARRPTQCTAVDVAGDEVTFNPESPGAPGIARIDSNPAVSLTCPTATECSAVDAVGKEVLFNPQSPRVASPTTLDPANQLNSIACRTATDCVAVDSAGQAYEGDPRGVARWSVQQIAGGSPVAGVACPSALECVAVDTGGYQFVGSSGPLPPVPGRISPPKIGGTSRAGRVLRESHGKWAGSATSFRYQWQRCNKAGRRCASIPGATRQTYMLAARDAGHRIRVLEWAFNISGTGSPATSRATAIVRPRVAVAATRLSLSGVAERKPRLAFTVTAGPGEQPLKAIAVRLPGFLDISRSNFRAPARGSRSTHGAGHSSSRQGSPGERSR